MALSILQILWTLNLIATLTEDAHLVAERDEVTFGVTVQRTGVARVQIQVRWFWTKLSTTFKSCLSSTYFDNIKESRKQFKSSIKREYVSHRDLFSTFQNSTGKVEVKLYNT